MTKYDYEVPSFGLSLEEIDDVEIFRITKNRGIEEDGWPGNFMRQVSDYIILEPEDAKNVMSLFLGLVAGNSARCHNPPWGLAFYRQKKLTYTITLCFECSNAYVHTAEGRELRAFDVSQNCAVKLFDFLNQYLPLDMEGGNESNAVQQGSFASLFPNASPISTFRYWSAIPSPNAIGHLVQAIHDGDDVNEHTGDGYTALHRAAENGCVDNVKVLLGCGADITIRTTSGKTAFDFAKQHGHDMIADLLELPPLPNHEKPWWKFW